MSTEECDNWPETVQYPAIMFILRQIHVPENSPGAIKLGYTDLDHSSNHGMACMHSHTGTTNTIRYRFHHWSTDYSHTLDDNLNRFNTHGTNACELSAIAYNSSAATPKVKRYIHNNSVVECWNHYYITSCSTIIIRKCHDTKKFRKKHKEYE